LDINRWIIKYKENWNDRIAAAEDNTNSEGLVIWDKSNLDEDLNLAMISLKKNDELNDLHSMAIDYNNIGQLLKEKGDLDEALQ
jgi:hypothetical protein